jgi:uncharacterized protein DUF5670
MLLKFAALLIILWLLGVITSTAVGGAIHILLVIAAVVIVWNFMSGPKRI